MERLLRSFIQMRLFRDNPLFDGTISDLANALYMDNVRRPKRYAELIESAGTGAIGYIQLKTRQFRSRSIEDYAAVVEDPQAWNSLDATMDRYFADRVNMFPYERRRYEDELPEESTGEQFENPESFHIVQKIMIERRFAAGATTDLGESDLKEAVSSFRYVFVFNFWRLVLARRGVAVQGIGIILLCGAAFIGLLAVNGGRELSFWVISLSAGLAATGMISAVWLTLDRIQRHTDKFEDATRASCNSLSRVLDIRLHSLTEIIPQLIDRINHSKWDVESTQLLEEWPLEVKKWSKLAFWLNARVEHIELLMQLQMWRIRRLHYGIRWIGRNLTALLATVALMSVAGVIWTGCLMVNSPVYATDDGLLIKAAGAMLSLLATALSVWISLMTFRASIPNLNLIRNTLNTEAMRGFRDVKLHDKVADFVRREKKSQVYYEKLQTRS